MKNNTLPSRSLASRALRFPLARHALTAAALSLATLLPAGAATVKDTVRLTFVFGTQQGTVDIRLFGDIAPKTVENFSKYVTLGSAHNYTGTAIHRSIAGFVVQGGGYVWTGETFNEIGDFGTVQDEYGLPNVEGTISMAKTSAPNSATNNWFISVADNRETLSPTGFAGSSNGGFTVFGEVANEASLNLIRYINEIPTYDIGNGFTDFPLYGDEGYLVIISKVELIGRDNAVNDRIHQWVKINGAWDTSSDNWKIVNGNGVIRPFTPDAEVLFSANTGGEITIAEPVRVADMKVSGPGNYVFIGGSITGALNASIPSTSGSLIKDGTGKLTFQDTTLTFAGGAKVNSGTLVLEGSTFNGNATVAAGATLKLDNATLHGDAAVGNGATLALNNSTQQGNTALATGAAFTLNNSTLQGNTTVASGAALTLGNSTVHGDATVASGATLTLDNSTLHGNVAVGTGITLALTMAPSTGTIQGSGVLAGTFAGSANVASRTNLNVSSALTFSGNTVLSSGATLTLDNATLSAAEVHNSGTLTGSGTIHTTGGFINHGTLAPGNASNTSAILIDGAFSNEGTLLLQIDADGPRDVLRNTGTANIVISGTVRLAIDPAFLADNGNTFNLGDLLSSTGTGTLAFTTSETDIAFVLADPTFSIKNIDLTTGDIELQRSVSGLPGLHPGLIDFANKLNAVAAADGGAFSAALSAIAAAGGDPAAEITKLSPLGFASLTALPIGIASDHITALRGRLDSLRAWKKNVPQPTADKEALAQDHSAYVVAKQTESSGVFNSDSPTPALLSTYVLATGAFAKNGTGAENPLFDTDTYGGAVGLDALVSESFLAGVNLGGYSGNAKLHNNGGKIKSTEFLLAAYASYTVNDQLSFDAAVHGGFTSYDTTRNSLSGTSSNSGSTDGVAAGVSVYANSRVPLTRNIEIRPFAGIEFVHATVDSFQEENGAGYLPLAVDSFTQDSLRVKIGASFGWRVARDLRISLNAAYARELLDSETDIEASFVQYPGVGKFKVTAPSTPENILEVGPALEYRLGQNAVLSLGYNFVTDLEDQTAHRLNAAFQWRF